MFRYFCRFGASPAGRAPTIPIRIVGARPAGDAGELRRASLLCLVQETQWVVIAERNFASIRALVVFWIHID